MLDLSTYDALRGKGDIFWVAQDGRRWRLYPDLSSASGQATLLLQAENNSAWTTVHAFKSDGSSRFASYTAAAGQNIDTANEIVNFETLAWDDHSMVTTGAAWRCTFTQPGKYEIKACVTFAAAIGANVASYLYLYKNAAGYRLLDFKFGDAVAVHALAGSAVVDVTTGDYIDIRCNQASGGGIALDTTATNNWVSVYRISGS